MHKHCFRWISLASLFLYCIPIIAQKEIKGIVYDKESSETIVNANIVIDGTSIGCLSGVDGTFEIRASQGQLLRISFIGYTPVDVVVDERDFYEVYLEPGTGLEEVVLIGFRGKERVDVDRATPVDIIETRDLQNTYQNDLGQMVQFTAPSYNTAKYGVNGTTNYADPASLKGLGTDQLLVLVNGLRRHQFSTLNLNVAPGLGTVVTDLNSIPTAAVKRVEVLREGAAAQFGSDAIAGVINLALKDQSNGGSFTSLAGLHISSPDDPASSGRSFEDGFTIKNSLNYGLGLGKTGSFLNFTLEYFNFQGTNRQDYYTGPLYPEVPVDQPRDGDGNIIPTEDYPYFTDDPRAERSFYPDDDFLVGTFGGNPNETKQFFVNTAYPIGTKGVDWFAFGGYSEKYITSYGFFRPPAQYSRAVLTVFPDGYVPILPGQSTDYSVATGLRAPLGNDWASEWSYGFGHNDLQLWNYNSTNPSMGSATPTSFFVGKYWFQQHIWSADVNKDFGSVMGLGGLHLALGTQYRLDRYQQFLGSPESYKIGPLALEGKDVGSSARPGVQDQNDIQRSNFGLYADMEADVNSKLLLATALRFERYSDFGNNVSGRLAVRYKFLKDLALRASYDRGFRAPSVAQLGTINNTSTGQNGVIVITRQVDAADPRLEQLGIEHPRAEISNGFNVGITSRLANGRLLLTLDGYQVHINDRVVISERISTSLFPAVAALFPNEKEIRFFTNHISTRTTGIDLVLSYQKVFDPKHSLDLSFAGNYSGTEVVSQKDTPEELLAGAAEEDRDLKLLGLTAIELIEVAVPRTKLIFNCNYHWNRWKVDLRTTRFGEVQAYSSGLSPDDPNVHRDPEDDRPGGVQTFAAKWVTDLSIGYELGKNLLLTIGSNNIFDVYPDKYNATANGFAGQANSYLNGQIPYSRNSNQFGFNGRFVYASVVITLK